MRHNATLGQIGALNFLSFNVQNLLHTVGKYIRVEGNRYESHPELNSYQKSPQDILRIQKIIEEEMPDIATFQEIEDIMALQYLVSSPKLRGKYKVYLIEGNDQRGIDVGFIVKSDLPFVVDYQTHKDITWYDPVEHVKGPLFSRDLPVVMLRTEQDKNPFLIVIGNHAKSQRDRPGDPNSTILRQAQYAKAAEIIKNYEERYPGVQIIFGGDFNVDVRTSTDIKPLLENNMKSAFDVARVSVSWSERITHSYFQNGSRPHYPQMDDLMVTPGLFSNVIKASVIQYKNEDGSIVPLPKSYKERQRQPSDHNAIKTVISTRGLF